MKMFASKTWPSIWGALVFGCVCMTPVSAGANQNQLEVRVIDALSGEPVADDLEYHFISITGADGRNRLTYPSHESKEGFLFDLPSFHTAQSARFVYRAYNEWPRQPPKVVTELGTLVVEIGQLEITVLNGSDGTPRAGWSVDRYKYDANGNRQFDAHLQTNSEGRIRLNTSFSNGERYEFVGRGWKFIDGRRINSYNTGPVSAAGCYTLHVGEGNAAAVVGQSVCSSNTSQPIQFGDAPPQASNLGFLLRGLVDTNAGIETVEVSVDGGTSYRALVTPDTGEWQIEAPSEWLAMAPRVLNIVARALGTEDTEVGRASLELDVRDASNDSIKISSPLNTANVEEKGFVINGQARPNSNVSVSVALASSSNSPFVQQNQIYVADDGRFSWLVPSGAALQEGQQLVATVTATTDGGVSSSRITLQVVATDLFTRHVLNRITWGITPSLLDYVRCIGGVERYIDEQLNRLPLRQECITPNTILDYPLDDMLVRVGGDEERILRDPHNNVSYAMTANTLFRSAYYPYQLEDKLSRFWENHFNTDLSDTSNVNKLVEKRQFRLHALGNFKNLLHASATGPAMLTYLNGDSNVAGKLNQNYAREVLELHTLGASTNENRTYTDEDIVEVARAFTGWGNRKWGAIQASCGARCPNGMSFNPRTHDSGADKRVFGMPITPRDGDSGFEEGFEVLGLMLEHDSHAPFICGKLAQFLIDDEPPAEAVDECVVAYRNAQNNPDQIQQAIRAIVDSAAFRDPNNFQRKAKTEPEYVVSMLRYLEYDVRLNSPDGPYHHLRKLSSYLSHWPSPDGYPEVGVAWLSDKLIRERIQLVTHYFYGFWSYNGVSGGRSPFFDVLRQKGYFTRDAVLFFLADLALGNGLTPAIENQLDDQVDATDILPANYKLGPDSENKGREHTLIITLLGSPQFQLQ